MNRAVTFLAIFLALSSTAPAQSRKKTVQQPVKTPEEILYDELLQSTAKVMFIDSLVTDLDGFLSLIPLPKDAGSLEMLDGHVRYTNEFGDTRVFSQGDSITGQYLYISHRDGKEWSSPQRLSELGSDAPAFPFLMADGVTLYFSAEGEGTVGGRDIFRTQYNSSDLEFYEATNAGLPFNSPANDYLLAVSDIDNIGWLVTDRNQEAGKVCIYTFEPPAQRVSFDGDTPEDELRSYAEINAIRDTWSFGDAEAAVRRQGAVIARLDEKDETGGIFFVVNDRTVYTSPSDFSSDASRKLYGEIEEARKKAESTGVLLESMRSSYASSEGSKRLAMGRKIAETEEELKGLLEDTARKEKELRNRENR